MWKLLIIVMIYGFRNQCGILEYVMYFVLMFIEKLSNELYY